MKKILIILLLFFVVGCTGNNNKNVSPDAITIINELDKNEVIIEGQALKLIAIVTPSNAPQDVIWSSSDEQIATVNENGEVTGLKEGSVTIIAKTKDFEVYDMIDLIVYNDVRNLKTIEGIIEYLDTIIPSIAGETLPFEYRIEGARLSWSTSDENIITRTGRVNPSNVDKVITVVCKIDLGRVSGEFTKEVMVKKYNLRDISNKKLAFTYLYDYSGSYKGFREGDLEKIDVINYAFGGISAGKVVVSTSSKLLDITAEAHKHGVRVVLAVGGWGVDGFSDAALTAASRKVFIDSLLVAIDKYSLNGIDFDWEYPTSTAGGLIKARPEDKVNFTYLVQETYTALKAKDPSLTLSIAVPNGSWAASNYYEPAKLNNYIDYLHLMSYDMINYASSTNKIVQSSHHTNMYSSTNSVSSAENGVKAYSDLGISKSKIVIGVAFYGHGFKVSNAGNNGMKANTDTSISGNKFTVSYNDIVDKYLSDSKYQVFYDEQAKAHWLYGDNTVISYDSPESIAVKAEYAINNNLCGLMVWQYNQDHKTSILTNAIYDNLNKK